MECGHVRRMRNRADCLRRMTCRLVEDESPGDARHEGDPGDVRLASCAPEGSLTGRQALRRGSFKPVVGTPGIRVIQV